MSNMSAYNLWILIIVIQGVSAESHVQSLLPFLPTPEGTTVNEIVSRQLEIQEHRTRHPRYLVSILSLLWPQVVGPMHDGIIVDPDYYDIPKTPLENHLDTLRQQSRREESARQLIRDVINTGVSPEIHISPDFEEHLHHRRT